MWEAQLDLATFLGCLVVFLLVIRGPALVSYLWRDRLLPFRHYLLQQLMLSFIDWLVLPFFLLVLLFPWRISYMRSQWIEVPLLSWSCS